MGAVCGCLRGPPQSPQNNGGRRRHQHHNQETQDFISTFVYSYRHIQSSTTQFPFSKNPAENSQLLSTSIKAKSVESGFKYLACEPEEWHENSCVICFEEYTDDNPKITTECCRQYYHLTCIYEWKNRSETCPTCRQEMIFNEMT